MKRNSYFPSRVADQVTWLLNFANKLPAYAAILGLSNAQRDAAIADARWLAYVLQTWLGAVRAWSLACTDAAKEAQHGPDGSLMELPVFTAPALPLGVVAVNKGALERLFVLVQLIKEGGKCTETIGTDLGVFGAEDTGPDLNTVQPIIKVKNVVGGVFVDWNWGGHRAFLDMAELQVDRGDGQGWRTLAFDTTPGYTDTHPAPATPTRTKYRAIYRVGDHQVGLWSAEESAVVGG
jgi:hypothetical protein